MNKTAEANPKTAEAAFARQVLDAEAAAVQRIEIDESFHAAIDLILQRANDEADGSVVVGGLGKSGIIARKVSATLSSTGTPSHFLHPAEAMHGDLGRLRRSDVVLLLSYGGNTEEVVSLAAILRQDGVPVIAITSNGDNDLARLATITLRIGDVAEACPLNLAPTASSTAMLALGDALAMAVSRRRSFTAEDFAKRHPGGSLGRQLMPITSALRFRVGENLALITRELTLKDAYAQAASVSTNLRQAGALLVVDGDGKLAGIFTDGDLRKHLLADGPTVWDRPITDVMVATPKRLRDDALVRDAVRLIREKRIDEIPVVDAEDRPIGLIDVQDLVAMKVIS